MRPLTMAGVLLLAACGPGESGAPLPAKKPAPKAAPAEVPAAPLPGPATVPVVAHGEKPPARPALPPEPPPAAPEMKPAVAPPPLRPWTKDPAPTTPCFTFHTMDHLKAYVIINGERVTDTPCLWAYSLSYEFDPKIPVTDWPPRTAAFAGAASTRDEPGRAGSTIEIAIEGGQYDGAGRERLKRAFPHLAPGEQVLYVNAEILGKIRRGALRLKLVSEDGTPYRYTNFTPIQSMEEEAASRFSRSIWFQRESSD